GRLRRFKVIRAGHEAQGTPTRQASSQALYAFGRFYERFSLSDPLPAIEQLASELELGPVDTQVDPQVALYALLERNHDIDWVRQRTARRATLLDALAEECWPGLSITEERETATAGI